MMYGFDEEHDPNRPAQMWFQESEEGEILFGQPLSLAEQFRMEQGLEVQNRVRKLYPDGILVDRRDNETAMRETVELMKNPDVSTIFEATFSSDGYITKTDILERKDAVRKILNETYEEKIDNPEFIDRLDIESGVEMVSPLSRRTNKLPFGMIDDSGDYDFRYINFETDSADKIRINSDNLSGSIRFVSWLGRENELVITKVFEFHTDSYVFDIKVSIKNNSDMGIKLGKL